MMGSGNRRAEARRFGVIPRAASEARGILPRVLRSLFPVV